MDIKPPIVKGVGPFKKPYKSPRLEVYGDIRDLTNSAGMSSMTADGGMGGMTKTA